MGLHEERKAKLWWLNSFQILGGWFFSVEKVIMKTEAILSQQAGNMFKKHLKHVFLPKGKRDDIVENNGTFSFKGSVQIILYLILFA